LAISGLIRTEALARFSFKAFFGNGRFRRLREESILLSAFKSFSPLKQPATKRSALAPAFVSPANETFIEAS
jgi:hypothetical protein